MNQRNKGETATKTTREKGRTTVQRQYLALNERLLSALGAWPRVGKDRLSPRVLLALVNVVLFQVSGINQIRLTPSDVPVLMQCLTVMGVTLLAAQKLFSLASNRERVLRMVRAARERRDAQLDSMDAQTSLFTWFMLGTVVVIVGVMIAQGPVAHYLTEAPFANATRWSLPLKIAVPVPFADSYLGFSLLYLYHSACGIYHVVAVPALDGLLVGFLQQAAGRLRLLRRDFERLHEDVVRDGFESGTDAYETKLKQLLAQRVREHQEMFRYLEDLEHIMHKPMITQFFMSSALFSGSAYLIVTFPSNPVLFIREGTLMVSGLFQLGAYCFFADRVNQETDSIGLSAYSSQWADAGPKHARSLCLVMLRSQRPARVTVGKFVELSLETYAAILKGAFTFFTLLTGLNECEDAIKRNLSTNSRKG